MKIASHDWQALSRLLDDALALPVAARLSWLSQLGSEHAALRPVLQDLLTREDLSETSGFLEALPKISLPAEPPSGTGPKPGDVVGPYRLERLLGSGGMSTVWIAERFDGLLKRKVALKLPQVSGQIAGLAARMERERDILASLQHPHIARLYDTGIARDGHPYLAIEYVDGEPIDRYCTSRQLDLRTRLRLIVQVARAVAFAHAHLVIHRDLKPSNILVDAQGEVHLLDFGIATLLEVRGASGGLQSQSALTRQMGVLLTPEYASPEQVRGERAITASDVYSLGINICELLTGRRPYQVEAVDQISLAAAILEAPATPPSSLAAEPALCRTLRGDLDSIVLKALRKKPQERYATVAELADDIERYLQGGAVRARAGNKWYLARKFVARHRMAAATATMVVAALATGLAGVSWDAHRIALERDYASQAAAREQAIRYYLTNMFRASVAAHGQEPTTARAMLDRSAQRVLREYKDDPLVRGKVVESLADLYGALEDVEGARPLLEGFLAQADAERDSEAVAVARQKLANLELLRGNTKRAAQLLDLAEPLWERSLGRFREQRLEGMVIRARLKREQGDLEGSIRTSEAAIRERIALSGLNNRETAILYNSLAITLSALNRNEEALSDYRVALGIYTTLGQAEDIDALIMLANTGTLAARVGRIAEAETLLHSAYRRERAAAGDSAAVAAAMGYFGFVVSQRGRPAEAVPILQEAVSIAEKFTGPASPLTLRDRLFLAEAYALGGERDIARTLVHETWTAAQAQYGADHLLTLSAALSAARLTLATGEASSAQAQVDALLPPLRRAGVSAAPALADATLLLGEILIAQGRGADAVVALRDSVSMREKLVWDRSWQLAQVRARLGEAMLQQHDARGRSLLKQAVLVLSEQLGPSHLQTLRARQALSN
jgi:eukaryotic-like serine/threonine-protein kinase